MNPRKTMSYVALKALEGKEGKLSLTKDINSTSNLLPKRLHCKDKTFQFTRGLVITDERAAFKNQRWHSS